MYYTDTNALIKKIKHNLNFTKCAYVSDVI